MEGLKDIIAKISSYNIFNYLLPGILFVVLAKLITGINWIQENNVFGAFLYYFIGMVISRCGSVFIEPFLKWIKFLKFKEYKSYVAASKQDQKIELLSEVNNTYRTLLSMLILLILMKINIHFGILDSVSSGIRTLLLLAFLTLLFLFGYRKQTNYITKRIDANLKP